VPGTRIPYGPGVSQAVEWMGTTGPTRSTVVVAVHGGFWRARYGLDHLRPFCRALASRGFPVASLEYRRLGEPGGGWAGTLEDVESALASVAARAQEVLHVSAALLVGHSAGGQLALWAASRAKASFGRTLPLVGAVGLAAASDLVEAFQRDLSHGVVREFVGGSPEDVPQRYRQASPLLLLPLGVPTVLVHGTDDEDVPYAMSSAYVERARSAGDEAHLVTLEGGGHFDVIEPESRFWPQVRDAIESLT
jgi:acetyl esterase/lipase